MSNISKSYFTCITQTVTQPAGHGRTVDALTYVVDHDAAEDGAASLSERVLDDLQHALSRLAVLGHRVVQVRHAGRPRGGMSDA